ncbi:MAG: tyrosine-protein phosphatase [Bacteroidales bacterium]
MALFNFVKRFTSPSPRPVGAELWRKFADMHSHIIPGVDDGSGSFEESTEMIKVAYRSGVRQLYATSHIRDGWRTESAALKEKFSALLAWKERVGYNDLTLHLSAEYMMDDLFIDQLKRGDILPMPGNLLLLETSYYAPAYNLNDMLFEVQIAGYTPLLAHPERYQFYQEKPEAYDTFKEKGYLFQLDLLSLEGAYGRTTRKTALMLLEKGYIDYVGSDMHSVRDAEAIERLLQSPDSAPLFSLLHR